MKLVPFRAESIKHTTESALQGLGARGLKGMLVTRGDKQKGGATPHGGV